MQRNGYDDRKRAFEQRREVLHYLSQHASQKGGGGPHVLILK
jgi:hypothetical protein